LKTYEPLEFEYQNIYDNVSMFSDELVAEIMLNPSSIQIFFFNPKMEIYGSRMLKNQEICRKMASGHL